jgi:hypothetical protein
MAIACVRSSCTRAESTSYLQIKDPLIVDDEEQICLQIKYLRWRSGHVALGLLPPRVLEPRGRGAGAGTADEGLELATPAEVVNQFFNPAPCSLLLAAPCRNRFYYFIPAPCYLRSPSDSVSLVNSKLTPSTELSHGRGSSLNMWRTGSPFETCDTTIVNVGRRSLMPRRALTAAGLDGLWI